MDGVEDACLVDCEEPKTDALKEENQNSDQGTDNNENEDAIEEPKWWDSESQHLLNSQQLVEALSLCEDLFHSQSPNRDDKSEEHKDRPGLSVYAHLGPEHLKRDIEECQKLAIDTANIDLDTPPDFRLSQLVLSNLSFAIFSLTNGFSFILTHFHALIGVWFTR